MLEARWPGEADQAMGLHRVRRARHQVVTKGEARGAPGLGDLGIRYGYQRFLPEVMIAVVLVLIVFVQAVQSLGDWLVRRLSHK